MPLARRSTIVAASGSSVAVERRAFRPQNITGNITAPVKTPDRQVQAQLFELASRVRRLTISRRDPERFFEDRSELAHELDKLAGAIR